MRRTIVPGLAVIGLALGLVLPAAAGPAQIFGKWVETGPNGTEMVTEFTATTAWSYGLDPSGNRVGNSTRFPVTYKDIDPSTIQVDTSAGDRFLLHIRNDDTIVMEFPGVGVHTLTRADR
ncbi:MAG TPA: hypothetical protein VMD53_05290 [Rhizomicrobium sp.]|nr:hypothetical protein [Rhizomicrobium sp.]